MVASPVPESAARALFQLQLAPCLNFYFSNHSERIRTRCVTHKKMPGIAVHCVTFSPTPVVAKLTHDHYAVDVNPTQEFE
jgi:hypothetical protein